MSYNITLNPAFSPSPESTSAMTSFLESFYATSDTESAHDKYPSYFTDDATLIMGSKVAKGSQEILTLRHNLWTHVASRKHSPTKVFFGGPRELMLYGTARFVLRADADKQEVEVPWAGRVVFGEGEELKMRFYQVYLDPTVQSGKK
ncbi:uncharacterized protein BDW47DRAFT_109981 [Aspergillus candidus]|uniref:SnoaL-like domain-containing protein n=1 Tax=Aspergillus candidus TaxID=41067 RepID=A0A2I2F4V8_ASPCN|nr:hypothetical protein BDW47DRAFT_109981 [Aspergillus candidus]PLB35681.1 hypothetical protein BDW47DRAFT_109981 [Aspergillus candidus]